ncbi:unnamed protein product [Oikopleura dioica]|uniref:Uncharacterized protein n=1 Tax=Oikopleura dioica TaxID=34765 RepID=E4WUU1_OIKDI|nr:unnamed protein product [Oikopleura dioica]
MSILDIELNGIDDEEVAKVIREVRPNWNLDMLRSKCYSHSMTNTVSHFFINSREDEDSIVVRVNGEAAFLDRKKELVAFERLAKAGIADELLASFKNGTRSKIRTFCHLKLNRHYIKTINQFVSMIPDKYSDVQKEAARRTIQLPESAELKKLIKESTLALANQTHPTSRLPQ